MSITSSKNSTPENKILITIDNNCYKNGNKIISNFIIEKMHFKSAFFGGKEFLIITIINKNGNKLNTVFDKKLTIQNFNIQMVTQGNYIFEGNIKELNSIIDELKSKCFQTIYR